MVVVQYDDWLIFPGDHAFELSCATNDKEEEGGKKRTSLVPSVGLADPDPSAKELPPHRKSTVTAGDGEGSAVFTPDDIRHVT